MAAAEDENGEIPLIIFIGDGVSDLPAAREADVLFARKGLRLEEYCIENNVPFTGFNSFSEIKKEVEAIMREDQDKTGGVGTPARFNPRANMWRRVSSRQAVSSRCPGVMKHTNCARCRNSWPPRRRRKRRCFCGPNFQNIDRKTRGPIPRSVCIWYRNGRLGGFHRHNVNRCRVNGLDLGGAYKL